MLLRRSLSTVTRTLRPTIRQLLSQDTQTNATTPVQVNGWIKSVRRQKRVAFAVITDGSSPQGLQAVFPDITLARRCVPTLFHFDLEFTETEKSLPPYVSLTNGAAVRLTGLLTDSIGPGQDKELQVHAADIVGECDPEVSPGMLPHCPFMTTITTPLP